MHQETRTQPVDTFAITGNTAYADDRSRLQHCPRFAAEQAVHVRTCSGRLPLQLDPLMPMLHSPLVPGKSPPRGAHQILCLLWKKKRQKEITEPQKTLKRLMQLELVRPSPCRCRTDPSLHKRKSMWSPVRLETCQQGILRASLEQRSSRETAIHRGMLHKYTVPDMNKSAPFGAGTSTIHIYALGRSQCIRDKPESSLSELTATGKHT